MKTASTLGFYVCKKDAQTGCGLCGAVCTLKGADGSQQMAWSDAAGRLRFHACTNVEYLLREEVAPQGYCPMQGARRLFFTEEGGLLLDGAPASCCVIENFKALDA